MTRIGLILVKKRRTKAIFFLLINSSEALLEMYLSCDLALFPMASEKGEESGES
jgi:hypothetical protein